MTDPLAHWPARTTLTDASGHPVLVYSLSADARDGRPWADGVWRPPDVPPATAVVVAFDHLPGYAVSTSDPELADAWRAAGAEPLRHAHVMSHDLSGIETLRAAATEGVHIHRLTRQQLLRQAARIAPIMVTAYPPGHPDHRFTSVDHAVRSLGLVAADEVLGPFLDISQVAVLDRTVIGAALVVDRVGAAPEGGPWVLDIFRDPASPARGVGRAMMAAVLDAAKSQDLPSMTLVVSHSNVTAMGMYESLGFVDREQSWTLGLP